MLYLEQPEQFKNPQKIVGCFVECQGKILLLKRQDHKEHGNDYGPPGGKVDATDATLADAISRELFEETGLIFKPEELEYITVFYVKYDDNRDFLYYQYKVIIPEFPVIGVNPTEHKGYIWVTPQEALTMPLIHDEEYCIEHVYGIQ